MRDDELRAFVALLQCEDAALGKEELFMKTALAASVVIDTIKQRAKDLPDARKGLASLVGDMERNLARRFEE
jgi:hypothetical protein